MCPITKIKHKFSVLSSFFQLFHSSSVMASLNSQNKHLTHILMQFGFCSFDFPKSWLSSHFQLLSLCNLKCETSGPKGERRWNSRKEEEKVFASKYDLYYKPSWSPLLWGLTKNLFCTWTKSRTNWLRSKENTRAQLLKKDEKFKVWAGCRKENGSEPALKQSWNGTPLFRQIIAWEKLNITSANKGNQNRKAILWIKIDQSYEICTVWFYSFGSGMV